MITQDVPVRELVESPRNPRHHPEPQLETLVRSIRAFGFNNPVLITPDREIIAGHGRVRAAQRLNLDTVPCVVLDHLDDTQKRAYCLADNRIAEGGGLGRRPADPGTQ